MRIQKGSREMSFLVEGATSISGEFLGSQYTPLFQTLRDILFALSALFRCHTWSVLAVHLLWKQKICIFYNFRILFS